MSTPGIGGEGLLPLLGGCPPCRGPAGGGPVVQTNHRLLIPSGTPLHSLHVPACPSAATHTSCTCVRPCVHTRAHTHTRTGTRCSLAHIAVPADLHVAPAPAQRGPCRCHTCGSPAARRHPLPSPRSAPSAAQVTDTVICVFHLSPVTRI